MVRRFYLLKNGTLLIQRIEPRASTIISKTVSEDKMKTVISELLRNVEDFELKNEFIFATVNGSSPVSYLVNRLLATFRVLFPMLCSPYVLVLAGLGRCRTLFLWEILIYS